VPVSGLKLQVRTALSLGERFSTSTISDIGETRRLIMTSIMTKHEFKGDYTHKMLRTSVIQIYR